MGENTKWLAQFI